MKLLADTQFGVCTFFGVCDEAVGDKCGANGLPLTPSSIRMIGRFQKLKTLDHVYLSKYLDIIRGKYERIYIISEHHRLNLTELIQRSVEERVKLLPKLAFQLASSVGFLHENGIVNRFLCAENVAVNEKGDLQLSQYGLYYVTNNGADVSFPIGNPYYFPPELLASNARDLQHRSGPKVDIWSIGIILLEVILGCRLCDIWNRKDLDSFIRLVLSAGRSDDQASFMDAAVAESKLKKIGDVVEIGNGIGDFVSSCLKRLPSQRPSSKSLLEFECVREFSLPIMWQMGLDSVFLCENRAAHLTPETLRAGVDLSEESLEFPLRSRPIEEAYALWKLAGSNIETILKKKGLVKAKPPICCLPDVAVDEYDVYGHEEERCYVTDLAIFSLNYANLVERLQSIDIEDYYPVIQLRYSDINGNNNDHHGDYPGVDGLPRNGLDSSQLPIIVKERDIGYQLQRMVLFHRLIEAYPFKKALVWHEAQVDIPPHYRGYVWAILLDVRAGDADAVYKRIDKDTPTPTDRQIEVDIPRCHQYDELLSSPEGHAKFKRILKAWVATNTQYVYWQGLDSLCAPFLHLHFAYEGLAFACMSNFIPKYLHNFFLKDNSSVIQEYLAVFNHLLAFHDPVLYVHLADIGFYPELYAIPWFLTMFAHVFPLHKLFHLWDTLLLGSNSFPLCVGVAILVQLRTRLLEFGFNECILLFSDMPDVDIEQCVTLSVELFKRTPVSATFRRHMPTIHQQRPRGASFSTYGVDFTGPLGLEPLSVGELKQLHFPRMCAHELLLLTGLVNDPPVRKLRNETLLAVDVRSTDEFARSAFPRSINIPDNVATTGDKLRLPPTPSGDRLQNHKGSMIVVIGGKDDNRAAEVATRLVFAGFPRVCVLNKGIDVLRHANILVVPAAGDMN